MKRKIKLLKEILRDCWRDLHKVELQYKPYTPNILGEHRKKI